VIDEVKGSPKPVILFIDEAHTMIGAGGQAGQGDAANLLKPALARGELRTIAATTWSEYKKYFEKDAALARRFQVIKVEEPSEEAATRMVRGLLRPLEEHHGVRIVDDAVVDAVRLSHRYLSGRQLPDKAISLLDTACSRVSISQAAAPAQIEMIRWEIHHLDVEIGILERESTTGADHRAALADLRAKRSLARADLETLQQRWQQERELVLQMRARRGKLEQAAAAELDRDAAAKEREPQSERQSEEPVASQSATGPLISPEEIESLRVELTDLTQQLAQLQGESPLTLDCVDGQAIAEVVSAWTGIPVGRMVKDEIRTVLSLKDLMKKRIVGQDHALDAIAQSIRTSRSGLTDPRRPIGVFLLVGPSGTGKTETAITLAELLYGGDQNMTVINMSEFKEEHKVSLLMGSPPGYVGYGEGGVLTEAVRRRPYSVVLLDEIEKAHPGVQDIFYQVFDKGTLRDGEGRDIDFKNTVLLMTSNAGTELITSLCADPDTRPSAEDLASALHPELLKTFKPAFLGRLRVIPFFALSDEVMRQIVVLQLQRIARRVADTYQAPFEYSDELVANIAERCTEVDTGARNIDHILSRTLLPELSAEFLARLADGATINSARVSLNTNGVFEYTVQ